MAKPVTKPKSASEIELNCWCIEMAMRWPIVSNGGYGQSGGFSQMPRVESDADVIGRANKIKAWVKS